MKKKIRTLHINNEEWKYVVKGDYKNKPFSFKNEIKRIRIYSPNKKMIEVYKSQGLNEFKNVKVNLDLNKCFIAKETLIIENLNGSEYITPFSIKKFILENLINHEYISES